jgi:hypothetical protein
MRTLWTIVRLGQVRRACLVGLVGLGLVARLE